MKFHSLYTVIYVTVIGVILSFALCRGDKAKLNYYDVAESVPYGTRDDDDNDGIYRYKGIGLDEKTRNEIKNIVEDFDLGGFVKNPFDLGSGQIMNDYCIVITIKNDPYLLQINDRGDIERNTFDLEKIDEIEGMFFYMNTRKNQAATFKNRELSKKLDDFIRENKSLIDGKIEGMNQTEPKYPPAIEWCRERYYDAADWVENRYYEYTSP